MGDNKELSEFMQEYGDDYSTTLTMSQLQYLVNEKNAAESRIQELEAQLQRLRAAAQKLSFGLVHDDPEWSPSKYTDSAFSSLQDALVET